MQISDTNQNFSSDDPVWVLLTELSLGDFLLDPDRKDKPAAGYLFETMQELGMSPECMENSARTLAGFAKEALTRTRPGRLEFSGRIRIFCQKKILDVVNATKTSRPYHIEQSQKQKQIFPDSVANRMGGWGYFLVERGKDLPPDSPAIPHNDIDLYLYKEGQ